LQERDSEGKARRRQVHPRQRPHPPARPATRHRRRGRPDPRRHGRRRPNPRGAAGGGQARLNPRGDGTSCTNSRGCRRTSADGLSTTSSTPCSVAWTPTRRSSRWCVPRCLSCRTIRNRTTSTPGWNSRSW